MASTQRNLMPCTTAVFAVLLVGGCQGSGTSQQSLPRGLRVTRSMPIAVEFGKHRIFQYSCLVGSNGAIWIFAHLIPGGRPNSIRLVWTRYNGTCWSRPGTLFANKARGATEHLTFGGVFSEDENPMILWSPGLFSEWVLAGHPLRLTVWGGDGKSKTGAFPGHVYGGGRTPIAGVRDGEGRSHFLYSGNLDPPEIYRLGLDGLSPQKPFHVIADKGDWRTPRAITGRSRWSYGDYALTLGSGGLHFVAQGYHGTFLGRLTKRIEYRALVNDKWLAPERISDSLGLGKVSRPSVAEDDAGNVHLVYDVYTRERGFTIYSRYRVKRDGVWSPANFLGDKGHSAVITNDRHGNVFCFWAEGEFGLGTEPRGYVQVWNSSMRSEPVHVAGNSGVRLIQGAQGDVWMAWRTWQVGVEGPAWRRWKEGVDGLAIQRLGVMGAESE